MIYYKVTKRVYSEQSMPFIGCNRELQKIKNVSNFGVGIIVCIGTYPRTFSTRNKIEAIKCVCIKDIHISAMFTF